MLMIRIAIMEDLPSILTIYENARKFMANTGNPNQWKTTHPPREVLMGDIQAKRLYVYEEDNCIHGVFMFLMEDDPTYAYIEGEWGKDAKYGVMHRVASGGEIKRLLDRMIAYCFDKIAYLRIDTHEDNIVMQKALLRNGFKKCGVIYLENGEPRIAYEKY